jgi:predicted MFS family arabinose efflux permease
MALSMPRTAGSVDVLESYPVGRPRARVAFAMTFALMLSDYLSRQVIAAVFPFLKAEWALSDAQLGSLVSVVALTVGVMSFPIAMVSDRVGRVRSVTIMAVVWGLATIACGFADNFLALLIARAVIGLGEAGYGGAAAAILARVFPVRSHATVLGTFLSAALFGSVLGVMLGGVLAKHFGWQTTFIIIGGLGLALAIAFPATVREPDDRGTGAEPCPPFIDVVRTLLGNRMTVLTFVSTGLAAFMQGALIAWAPSYLNRYYGLEPARAALGGGMVVLAAGLGMVIGGNMADRWSRNKRSNRLWVSMWYCLVSGIAFLAAFRMPPGAAQLLVICAAAFISGGFTGPSAAVVADTTPERIHASALALLSVSIAFLGMAPGPFVTGLLGDRFGLQVAMQMVPVVSLLAALLYCLAGRSYGASSHAQLESTLIRA